MLGTDKKRCVAQLLALTLTECFWACEPKVSLYCVCIVEVPTADDVERPNGIMYGPARSESTAIDRN